MLLFSFLQQRIMGEGDDTVTQYQYMTSRGKRHELQMGNDFIDIY